MVKPSCPIVVCLVLNLISYFYSSTVVFLTILVVSILAFSGLHKLKNDSDHIKYKQHYKNLTNMSKSDGMRFNTSGKNGSSFDSGLFSNYDSRLCGPKKSLKSGAVFSPKQNITSPLRTNSRNSSAPMDENFFPRYPQSYINNDMPSPIRGGGNASGFTSPLSSSRRYNLNSDMRSSETLGGINLQRTSSSFRSEVLSPTTSAMYSPRSYSSRHQLNSEQAFFGSEVLLPANNLGVNEFPMIAHSRLPGMPGIIPMIHAESSLSSTQGIRSPSSNVDPNLCMRSRIRIKLTNPNRNDDQITESLEAVNFDNASTTKSVIQVLKEISRKRIYVPDDEEDEHTREPKRKPEHNLYQSRLEGEEELSLQSKGEDERTKRIRETEWDSMTMTESKRRRKNQQVNNEILSSLSSSIGLQVHIMKQAKNRRIRRSVGVSVETQFPEVGEGQANVKSMYRPYVETKETATQPDPPPPTRPRSPVKEKVVTNVTGILKSAVSKFDIRPMIKETEAVPTNGSLFPLPGSTTTAASASASLIASNAFTVSPIMSTASSQQLFAPSISFSPPVVTTPVISSLSKHESSVPNITFSGDLTTQLPTEKPKESNENKDVIKLAESPFKSSLIIEEKKDVPKSDMGAKIESNTATSHTDSTFNFGAPVSQPKTVDNPPMFNFQVPNVSKAPETSTSSSVFSFGNLQATRENPIKSPEPSKIQFGNSLSTPTSSALSEIKPSAPVTPSVLNTSGSAFTLQTNTTPPRAEPLTVENQTPTSMFNAFGQTGNKSTDPGKPSEVKPFQFGTSSGFTLGQSDSKNASELGQNLFSTTSSKSSLAPSAPVFPFTGSEKKDNKPGGFTFKAPPTTTSEPKSLFSFGTTPITANSTTTPPQVSTTPPQTTFSLFSSNAQHNTTSAASNQITTSNTTATLFGSATSVPSTFGNSTATTKPIFGSTTTAPASYGTGPNQQAFSTIKTGNIFGSGATNSTSSNPPAFGSTTNSTPGFGTSTATASSTSTGVPTFGSVAASGVGLPSFGSTVTTVSSALTFGALGASTTAPAFGTGSTVRPGTSTPAFGTTGILAFGSPVTNTATGAPFGSSLSSAVPFGSTAVSAPTFGSTSTFGTTTAGGTGQGIFGVAPNVSPFGSGTTTTVPPAFGGTTTAPIFGGTTTASLFGGTTSAPVFGGAPSISSSTAPAFGSTTTPSFGGNTTATPNFTTSQTFSTTQSAFGSPAPFGQNPAPPSFSASTFVSQGSTPSFNTVTSAFGSSGAPAQGSSPAFGSTGTPAQSSASAFGSTGTSAFGPSTPGFRTQDVNKPFTFNAGQQTAFNTTQPQQSTFNASQSQPTTFNASQPQQTTFNASQPQQTGGFNFNQSQAQQASPGAGLFQFGTSSNTIAQPTLQQQPFQFSAAQSNSAGFTASFSPGVGGSGQQMFSIGSGSTAPRRVTARRKNK